MPNQGLKKKLMRVHSGEENIEDNKKTPHLLWGFF